jgi:hypothetical protein
VTVTDLTKLQHDEQVALWIELTNQKHKDISAGLRPKPGRPEGGINAAVRELDIGRSGAFFCVLFALSRARVAD